MSPRPALGRTGKTLSVTVKVSQVEKDALEATYGTVYRGLRTGIELAIGRRDPIVTKNVVEPDHRHIRGQELEPTYDKGQQVRHYSCTKPGCTEILR